MTLLTAAQDNTPINNILITNATVFDGQNEKLATGMSILVQGNKITQMAQSITAPDSATVINAGGKVLMPGLIDAHFHISYSQFSVPELMASDMAMFTIKSVMGAEKALMRGFTTIRDMGGTPFSVKKAIDEGMIVGPRLYLSGPPISQTSGHFDSREYTAVPTESDAPLTYWNRNAVFRIADGPSDVLEGVRENLRMGATQIKLATGGGVSSSYDPLDVTEYTFEEIKAAVDAASDWNTYVATHVMTDKATRRSLEAGVQSIEHGFLMSDETMKLLHDKGAWLSIQPLLNDEDAFDFPDPDRHAKWIETTNGTDHAYKTAKKLGVKIAFGTDIVWTPGLDVKQGKFLAKLKRWFTPYEVLKMATYENAKLVKMCGPRDPYPGEIGVIKVGALADMILVDGNPLENIDLVADPGKNFVLIVKDGKIYKNTLK
jgi:imidazolonepropionase-like amidohydrolase